MTSSLLNLPHEVLHSIFSHVNPDDIARLSCCKTLHAFIKSDGLLFKEIYLKHFDDPREGGQSDNVDWEPSLHELVCLGKTLESEDENVRISKLGAIQRVVDILLKTAARPSPSSSSKNVAFLSRHFNHDRQNRQLLTQSSLYQWAAVDAWRPPSTCRHTNATGEGAIENYLVGSRESQEELIQELAMNIASPRYPPFRADRVLHASQEQSVQPPLGLRLSRAPMTEDLRIRQASAKLHCLYGVPLQEVHRSSTSPQRYSLRNDTALVHPYARSRTYDLRHQTNDSLWGPFFDNGSQDVDWEKVEAIMLILDHNMKLYSESHEIAIPLAVPDWTKPFIGAAPYSYISRHMNIPIEPALPLEAQDPYNITGRWMRVVCFLDYTELFDFNFAGNYPPPNQPRVPLDTEEAIRLIQMKLVVTSVEPPGPGDGGDLPVVWFRGTSSSVRPTWDPNANSKIRGSVRLTPEGEVRWTSWSIFHGEERWRSEGIQVGGVQSARGVLGYWFDKDYDEHGPAGPTAFWKANDGIEVQRSAENESGVHHQLHALHVPMY